jgi:hypothetical protein
MVLVKDRQPALNVVAIGITKKIMEDARNLLEEFVEWAKNCGEDVFYIFEETEESIHRFLEQREENP